MANRKRNKQIIVRVTEEERELIELKMAQLPTAQLGAYMKKIETSACSCTLDTLIDIAEALNIPLKKLFEFKD